MYRAILLDGQIECEAYEAGENGLDLFDGAGDLVAFVPYDNLIAVINEDTYEFDEEDERSIM